MPRSFLNSQWLLLALPALVLIASITAGNGQAPAVVPAKTTATVEKIVDKPEGKAPQPIEFAAINDLGLRAAFEKQLGDLKDAGESIDAKVLRKQLSRTKAADIKLETVADRVLEASAIYDLAKSGTLVFGNIYKCDRCDKWHGSMAGGVVLTADGVAVTNYHVVDADNAGAFGAMTVDGTMHAVEEVLAASKKDDVALVRLAKVEGHPFHAVPISLGDAVGSEVRVVSHPDGRFFSYSEGVIARYFVDRKSKAPRMQITADYARGSSGSGVFNEAGALTGLVSATTSIYYNQSREEQDNLQMVIKSSIPVAAIWDLIDRASKE